MNGLQGPGGGMPQSMPPAMVGNQQLPFANTNPNAGKKAVHVKWAGKTIALGTFPQAEADEKCARAKALTRAWRSTMRPKPTREWVMLELERLQVRVVSGRLGRRGSTGDSPDEGTDDEDDEEEMKKLQEKKKIKKEKVKKPKTPPSRDSLANKGKQGKEGELTTYDSISQGQAKQMYQRRNSFVAPPNTVGGFLLGLGAGDAGGNLDWAPQDATGLLSHDVGKDVGAEMGQPGGADENSLDAGVPPHRPLVGGGSAAAYEAARAHHYNNVAGQNRQGSKGKDKTKQTETGNNMGNMGISQDQQGGVGFNGMGNGTPGTPLSGGLGMGGLGGMGGSNSLGTSGTSSGLLGSGGGSGSSIPQLGLSVNPNQHYEMLKLHHMNLLNEIQETTLMMNLYQQQQLQQQQLQQQQDNQISQQNFPSPSDQSLALQLAQQQQVSGSNNPFLDSLYGAGGMSGAQNLSGLGGSSGLQQQQQRGLGLGGVGGAGSANQMQALLRQQNLLSGGMLQDTGSAIQRRLSLTNQSSLLGQDQPLTLEEQEELCQARLQRLKQDIAERQRMADALEGGSGLGKRNFGQDGGTYKRQRNSGEN
eukprot:CAMPEP_0172492430 /NCGR_PEP_ID=MMETSP1066-20121228/23578_1 /TAXON_ID=671091 /ORGANISM="Coscinodiscus wailesii, Strain CCMP2513" /LENGTH=588 /DNA_ID=CAMNT_0013262057 /DNA_START=246 /DNA_END=2012 /DNA_ORIENTATION=+